MSKKRNDNKAKIKITRQRSDLSIGEFGEATRNKDVSLSGKAASPYWNKSGPVWSIFMVFLSLIGRNTSLR
jgi:hypothetical protein